MLCENLAQNKMTDTMLKFAISLSLFFLNNLTIASEHLAGEPTFIGAMSCGTSTCHGARSESSVSNILRNEFNTWYENDPHSQSYKALTSPLGNQIGQNLGLEDTSSDPVCTSCHVTPTTGHKVSENFDQSEGVSCEGCHGPASLWLKPHSDANTNANLLELGMYPTEIPDQRANLCLSCHLGSGEDQIVTHKMMAAGHPRLVFELSTFSLIQPAHYKVDADYRSRKPEAEEVHVWAIGQIIAARQFLNLVKNHGSVENSLFPEFTFYECHTCHHSVDTIRWQTRRSNPLGPGRPRLNDSTILMSISLLKIVAPESSEKLATLIRQLHTSSATNARNLKETIEQIDDLLAGAEQSISNFNFNHDEVVKILKELTDAGKDGEYSDFSSAEQAVMAVALLVDNLTTSGNSAMLPDNIDGKLEDFYKMLENEDSFRPRRLQNKMKNLTGSIE